MPTVTESWIPGVIQTLDAETSDAMADAISDAMDNARDQFDESGVYQPRDFGEKLRAETIGVRISVRKFFARKSLSRDQVATAAEQFSADAQMLAASKSLLNTRDPAYKAVSAIINRARRT